MQEAGVTGSPSPAHPGPAAARSAEKRQTEGPQPEQAEMTYLLVSVHGRGMASSEVGPRTETPPTAHLSFQRPHSQLLPPPFLPLPCFTQTHLEIPPHSSLTIAMATKSSGLIRPRGALNWNCSWCWACWETHRAPPTLDPGAC